jgi:hypothetical protein
VRDRRGALRFALAMAAWVGIPIALLLVATRGRYWFHTVTANRNIMRWHELAGWARLLWSLYWPLIVAVGLLATQTIFRVIAGAGRAPAMSGPGAGTVTPRSAPARAGARSLPSSR